MGVRVINPDLSAPLTTFVGRTEELSDISTRLQDPACRLLTLVGPGGIGKTRLARHAAKQSASRYPDGVHFVALQPLASPEDIVSTIWERLGNRFLSSGDPKSELLTFLSGKSLLLLLDNLEHLLDGVALVSEMLTAAPGLKILATSRERLHLLEEWIFEVQGLPYPANLAAYQSRESDFSAVELFVRGAQRVQPGFQLADELPAVLRICRLVEGMPLALEMAAASTRLMSCSEIAAEIEHSLDILELPARNIPQRQRTMRLVLDRSWAMLSQSQSHSFAHVSIFRGGFTREASQVVTGMSLADLSALLDKSWLRWDPARKRYDIHEVLRQYGEEFLGRDENNWIEARDRHCDYFAALLHEQDSRFRADGSIEALARIENDLDNIRTCWDWAVRRRKTAQLDQSLDSLFLFYDTSGYYQEGVRAFGKAMKALEDRRAQPESVLLYARIQALRARLCYPLGRMDEALEEIEASISVLRAQNARADLAKALQTLALVCEFGPMHQIYLPLLEESVRLYRALGDHGGLADMLPYLACAYQKTYGLQQHEQALSLAWEGLRCATALGNEQFIAMAFITLGDIERFGGDYAAGLLHLQQALEHFKKGRIVWGLQVAHLKLADLLYANGDYKAALRQTYHSLSQETEFAVIDNILHILSIIAASYLDLGRIERGLELFALINSQPLAGLPLVHDNLATYTASSASESYRRAIERGRTLDLKTTLQAVRDELARMFDEHGPQDTLLTAREAEILQLMSAGMTNREMARQLYLSLGTVKWYSSEIYSKLNVKNRSQAVAHARELGLLEELKNQPST